MRTVSYFSGGIPSAVATKLAIAQGPVTIYNFEIKEEHPDNARFLDDCQEWFGQEIIKVGRDEYNRSTDEVYRQTRYLVGPGGARCTTELKKAMRWEVAKHDDRIILGYTAEEQTRHQRLLYSEPLLDLWPLLIERNMTREDCMAVFQRTGIEMPAMYKLGYRNNNCIGCVKGQAGYWNKIRVDFPERFEEMAKIERELERTVCKREWVDTRTGLRQLERMYLDEMPHDLGRYEAEPEAQCGMFCIMAEDDM